jgi:hypothetical protein
VRSPDAKKPYVLNLSVIGHVMHSLYRLWPGPCRLCGGGVLCLSVPNYGLRAWSPCLASNLANSNMASADPHSAAVACRADVRGGEAHKPVRHRQPRRPAGGVSARGARGPRQRIRWHRCLQQVHPPASAAATLTFSGCANYRTTA